jgi:diacylglycerol kinase family enzyme
MRTSIPPSPSDAGFAGGPRLPILLVGNPTSRSGKAAERITEARRLLAEADLAHEFRSTLPNGATIELVARAIAEEGFKTIVYLGGDGTFGEVAKGIYASGRADEVLLGMLPAGTANDQGKSFGISSSRRELKRNVEIIRTGYTTLLDIGEVTSLTDGGDVAKRDLFFDSMGWGLSAAILAFRNHELSIVKNMPVWRDMYRDHMVYVRAAVRQLAINWLTRDFFTAEISVDGAVHTLDRLSDLVISNTALYAGEWIIDPESRHDDGLFEVAPFTGTSDWTSKLIVNHKKVPLTEELLNRFGVSHTPNLRGARIEVQILRPNKDKRLPAQLDGDEFPPADHFIVKVLRRRLRIIVPEIYHWI